MLLAGACVVSCPEELQFSRNLVQIVENVPQSEEISIPVRLVGARNPRLVTVMCEAISRRLGRISCHRWSTVSVENRRFSGLKFTPAFLSSVSSFRTWSTGCSGDFEKMTMSSEYTKANGYFTEDSITSIVRAIVPGAFCRPNGIRIYLHRSWCNVKAVFLRSFSLISTSQYPLLASNVKNAVALPRKSTRSSTRGMRYESRFLESLSHQ